MVSCCLEFFGGYFVLGFFLCASFVIPDLMEFVTQQEDHGMDESHKLNAMWVSASTNGVCHHHHTLTWPWWNLCSLFGHFLVVPGFPAPMSYSDVLHCHVFPFPLLNFFSLSIIS